ncbi:hypothetical protein PHLGIDRAFT_283661 [Phlebiopsis gigantea 11061_1 CR5-6]|uniref:Uncharacterized protein n=1 Tax=Phlebiopsis gigantea (strain 11061_1 CR5-6) TaxID=745531 RepID=A0A0C3PC95_PHLG1|nr:hypothetical protein PHLGIDRAFT_283661 [Phlebiopsis gigantea 11061_1 CR5-6]
MTASSVFNGLQFIERLGDHGLESRFSTQQQRRVRKRLRRRGSTAAGRTAGLYEWPRICSRRLRGPRCAASVRRLTGESRVAPCSRRPDSHGRNKNTHMSRLG